MAGLKSFSETEGGANYVVSEGDATKVGQAVGLLFGGEGYSLEEGTATSGVYGKGSKVGRALLGAFVRRYKFRVTIAPQAPGSLVTLQKAMSGWGGGAIAAAGMKSELRRMITLLHDRLDAATPSAT